jgi:hypothetical protein
MHRRLEMFIPRDFYQDGLPDYPSIRRALRLSVVRVLDKDFDLLALGAHEQAIAHRIAVNLERRFPAYHVDCEYNRQKYKEKARPPEKDAPKTMRPDIIVHHRNTASNVLAVEMKAKANKGSTNDLAKLAILKADAPYLYKGTAFVCVQNGLQDLAEGKLRAIISWYDVTKRTVAERREERCELVCDKHQEQVIRIMKQRTKALSRRKL